MRVERVESERLNGLAGFGCSSEVIFKAGFSIDTSEFEAIFQNTEVNKIVDTINRCKKLNQYFVASTRLEMQCMSTFYCARPQCFKIIIIYEYFLFAKENA